MKINIKKTVKTIFAAVIISALSVTTGCKKAGEPAEEPITLRFGHTATNSDGLIGLVGVAKELGYLDEELSKVNAKFENIPFVKAGPAINAALASNEIDMAKLGDVPAVLAKSQGADTVLLDISYNTDNGETNLVIRNGLDADNVNQLKGKKIAVPTGSFMQRIFYQILEEAGMTPDDVEIVNMTEVDAGTAIASGSIDASPLTALKASKLYLAGDGKIIYSTKGDNQKSALTAIVGRSEFAEEHPEVVEAFFKALIRASEATETDKSVFRDLYIKSGIEENIVDNVFTEPGDYNNSVGTNEELLDNYQYVADFLKDNGLSDNSVDIREWFDGSYYDKAAASLQ